MKLRSDAWQVLSVFWRSAIRISRILSGEAALVCIRVVDNPSAKDRTALHCPALLWPKQCPSMCCLMQDAQDSKNSRPQRFTFRANLLQFHMLIQVAKFSSIWYGNYTNSSSQLVSSVASRGRLRRRADYILLWLLAHRALHFSRTRYVEGRRVNAGLSKSCSNLMHFAVQCCQSQFTGWMRVRRHG